MGLLLLVLILALCLGAAPGWDHSRDWGYGPSGLLGVVLLIVLILLLTGQIPSSGLRWPK